MSKTKTPPAAAPRATQILNLLSATTKDDLADVEAAIAAKKAAFEQATKQLRDELATLVRLRRILRVQLGLIDFSGLKKRHKPASAAQAPPGANGTPRPPSGNGQPSRITERLLAMTRHVVAKGPQSAKQFKDALMVSDPTVYEALKYDLFEKQADGRYGLTTKGHQFAKGEAVQPALKGGGE